MREAALAAAEAKAEAKAIARAAAEAKAEAEAEAKAVAKAKAAEKARLAAEAEAKAKVRCALPLVWYSCEYCTDHYYGSRALWHSTYHGCTYCGSLPWLYSVWLTMAPLTTIVAWISALQGSSALQWST